MSLSSYELLVELEERGILTKEASARTSQVRLELIKEAQRGYIRNMLSKIKGGADDLWQSALGRSTKPPADKTFAQKVVSPRLHPAVPKRAKKGQLPEEPPQGSWSNPLSNYIMALPLLGAAGAGVAGTNEAINALGRAAQRRQIEKSYRQIFDEEPALRDLPEENVREHFNLMARYAPTLASDPMVAASWVSQAKQRGDTLREIQMLTGLEQDVRKARAGTEYIKPDKAISFMSAGIPGMSGEG